jgi:tetratricopeptide (TPR) repeat protein
VADKGKQRAGIPVLAVLAAVLATGAPLGARSALAEDPSAAALGQSGGTSGATPAGSNSGPAPADGPADLAPPLLMVPGASAAAAAGPVRFGGIVLPVEHSGDLQAHWALRRDYLRDRDERRADDEEQRVREIKKDLGIENLFAIGSGLVREGLDALAAGSPAVARKRCALAVDLAPALPDAHSCLGRAVLSDEGGSFKVAFGELVSVLSAARNDPRTSRQALANAGTVGLIGVLLAGLSFVGLLLLRHARLYAHDVQHLFPAGTRRGQTRLFAVVLVSSPLLLRMGPVPLLVTALAACALYASRVELIAGCAVLLLVAATPAIVERTARIAAYGGIPADIYLLERGEGQPAALSRLRQRLEAQEPEFAVLFALAHKAKREGDLATAQTLYTRALQAKDASTDGLAAAHNNLGNAYLLSGDAPKATAEYGKALELSEGFAAAHFNLSRALGLGGVEMLEKVQTEQQRALSLDRAAIDAFTEDNLQVNRKANRFVLDAPVPEASLSALDASEASMAAAAGEEARSVLGGPLPPGLALLWPAFALAAFAGLHFLRTRLRPSTHCVRCGREVCKRCDGDARPAEGLCAQCVNVFVRRTNVDSAERARKEIGVAQYQARRSLVLRGLGLLSGAGHVVMGHPLRGLLFLLLTGTLLASVLLWHGLVPSPVAVQSSVSYLRVGVTAALFLAVHLLCFRDLLARQREEGG